MFVYSLWAPVANSAILPGRLPFPGTSRNRRSNSCMCAGGTISSRDPLSMRIGVVNGILVNFDAESHFWWHRNDKGASRGKVLGMSRGRFVNVFSRMRADICSGMASKLFEGGFGGGDMSTYLGGILRRQMDSDCTTDRLTI